MGYPEEKSPGEAHEIEYCQFESNPSSKGSDEEKQPPNDAGTPEEFVLDFNLAANIIALCVLTATGSWANLIPSSSISFISQRFPEEASDAAWISTALSVIGAIIQVMIGDLSDIFGRRIFLFFGCACGFVGTLVSARASSMRMVIGGQVLNGIGYACSFLASPLVQEIVPKKQRPLVIAFATALSSTTFICGPIIQGVFIQKNIGGEGEGWQVGFYIAAGLWTISGLGLALFYHPMARPNPENLTVVQRLKALDWIGMFLSAAGLALFLVGLSYGGNPFPWTSAIVLGTMIPGIVLCISFGLWEFKGTSTGILPHAIFRDRNYSVTVFVRVVGGIALLGCQAYMPQEAVYVFETDGLQTSIWQLPFSVVVVLGSFTAAFLMKFFKELRWITVGLLLLLILGAGLMLLVKPGVSFVVWFFPLVLMGLPSGAEASLLSVVSSYFVPNEFIATGVCVCNAATLLGGAVAVTMYSSVFNSKIKTALPAQLTESALDAGLPASSIPGMLSAYLSGNNSALQAVPGISPDVITAIQAGSKQAYSDSFRYIWYILVVFSVVCAAIALLFTSTERYMTDEVSAPVQRKKVVTKETMKRS